MPFFVLRPSTIARQGKGQMGGGMGGGREVRERSGADGEAEEEQREEGEHVSSEGL